MELKDIKVGMRVRVKDAKRYGSPHKPGMVGKTFRVVKIDRSGLPIALHVENVGEQWFDPQDLELVHSCGILTEKVLIKGQKCRTITGFQGILSRDELPERYLAGTPYFCMDGDRLTRYHTKNVDPYYGASFGVGCQFIEPEFQDILVWLKRAGNRLAKIRQQERDSWKGEELVEI